VWLLAKTYIYARSSQFTHSSNTPKLTNKFILLPSFLPRLPSHPPQIHHLHVSILTKNNMQWCIGDHWSDWKQMQAWILLSLLHWPNSISPSLMLEVFDFQAWVVVCMCELLINGGLYRWLEARFGRGCRS